MLNILCAVNRQDYKLTIFGCVQCLVALLFIRGIHRPTWNKQRIIAGRIISPASSCTREFVPFLMQGFHYRETETVSGIGKVGWLFNTPVSYTHLRAHETGRNLVCRLL